MNVSMKRVGGNLRSMGFTSHLPEAYQGHLKGPIKTAKDAFGAIGINIKGVSQLAPADIQQLFRKRNGLATHDIVSAYRVFLFQKLGEAKNNVFINAMELISREDKHDFTYLLLQQLNERSHWMISDGMAWALAKAGNTASDVHIEIIRLSLKKGIENAKGTEHSTLADELRAPLAFFNDRVSSAQNVPKKPARRSPRQSQHWPPPRSTEIGRRTWGNGSEWK